MWSYLVFGIAYAFAAAVQPGPLQTYIISQTIKKGWRATLPVALYPLISDVPILTLVLFLLNAVPEGFVVFLRFGGGLFLLYLAYKAFLSWYKFNANNAVSPDSNKQTLFKAVVVNLLNPAPYLGWSLIMGPIFMEGWSIQPSYGLAMIIGFYSTMVLTLAATIVLFGLAQKLGPVVNKILLGLSAVILFLFGIYQLYLGIVHFINP